MVDVGGDRPSCQLPLNDRCSIEPHYYESITKITILILPRSLSYLVSKSSCVVSRQ